MVHLPKFICGTMNNTILIETFETHCNLSIFDFNYIIFIFSYTI